MTDDLPDDFAASLDILASAASDMQDPWWIFGGAAMVLWGLQDWRAPDIDILCSPRDARRRRLGRRGRGARDQEGGEAGGDGETRHVGDPG